MQCGRRWQHRVDKLALRSYLTPFSVSISFVWQKNQLNSLLHLLINIFRNWREEKRPYHKLLSIANRLHINNKFPRGELRPCNLGDRYVIDVSEAPMSEAIIFESSLWLWFCWWKSHLLAITIEWHGKKR